MNKLSISKSLSLKKNLERDFILYEFQHVNRYGCLDRCDLHKFLRKPEKSLLGCDLNKNSLSYKELKKTFNLLKNEVFFNDCFCSDIRPQSSELYHGVEYFDNISYENIYSDILNIFGNNKKLIDRFIEIKQIDIKGINENKKPFLFGYLHEFHMSEAIIPLLINKIKEGKLTNKTARLLNRYITFFQKIIEHTTQSNSTDLNGFVNSWITELKEDSDKGFQFKKTRHDLERFI